MADTPSTNNRPTPSGQRPAKRPWLVAAWPGMGTVAMIAAGYLIKALDLRPFGELTPHDMFDVDGVSVEKGLISPPRLPRGVFFRASRPGRRPLIVFMGEAQPSAGTLDYARLIADKAAELGVGRIVTFASAASQMHPADEPRVFAAATTHDMLAEARGLGAQVLDNGQISGLNGVLLGVASERNLEGLCLLGQIPFFAPNVANPKAAMAVLAAFAQLAGLTLDTSELAERSAMVEGFLMQILDQMSPAQRAQVLGEGDEDDGDDGDDEATLVESGQPTSEPANAPQPPPDLDSAARQMLERLFREAGRDHTKAAALKEELDRLGVFAAYEERFLDLFKKA